MATTNTKPAYIPTPFANGGQKNVIPVNDQGNYLASWTLGFPSVTSEPLFAGGLPPDRLDVNGALNAISAFVCYLQAGGVFTYDPDLAQSIGGYANGQVLFYNNGTEVMLLKSTKSNNTDNFVSNPSFIGTSWVKISPTMTDVDDLGDKVSAIEGKIPGSASTSNKLATASDLQNIITTLYPVGSIYIGTQETCPLNVLIPSSTWVLVAQNRALWGGDGTNGNTTIDAGLPNITGDFQAMQRSGWTATSGAFYNANGGVIHTGSSHTPADETFGRFYFNANRSSSIYGNSETVQPPAYRVNVWRRTA